MIRIMSPSSVCATTNNSPFAASPIVSQPFLQSVVHQNRCESSHLYSARFAAARSPYDIGIEFRPTDRAMRCTIVALIRIRSDWDVRGSGNIGRADDAQAAPVETWVYRWVE